MIGKLLGHTQVQTTARCAHLCSLRQLLRNCGLVMVRAIISEPWKRSLGQSSLYAHFA